MSSFLKLLTMFFPLLIGSVCTVSAQYGVDQPDGDEVSCPNGTNTCCNVEGACNGPNSSFWNYDPDYSATGGCDLSCVIEGCTDETALNYSSAANNDDGSCEYPPGNFNFTPTAGSGLMLGEVTLNSVALLPEDWLAAFDSDGNCAGAVQALLNNGVAYIQLVIYADDATTFDIDEGMNDSESFTFQVYDSSEDAYYEYYDLVGETELEGWVNSNGAPIPTYSDPEVQFDFHSTPYTPSCLDFGACNYD